MEQAGWFQYVKGFLIGRPNSAYGQEMMGLDAYQAVLEVAGRKNVPVIMDADIGHLPPMMPIVSGSLAKVSAKDNGAAGTKLQKLYEKIRKFTCQKSVSVIE